MGAMQGLVASAARSHAVRLLGTDLDHVFPADRLRPSPRGGAARCLPGAGRHRAAAGFRCSPACCAGNVTGVTSCRLWRHGPRHPGEPALSCGACARARRRFHQIGAVSFPFLVAQRDGGADAGFGLSAFGDNGEGRRLSGDAAEPGAWRHARMGDDPAAFRRGDAGRRRRCWRSGRPT